MSQTYLVLFGGMTRHALSDTIDVVAASAALRALPDRLDPLDRILITDTGSASAMLRLIAPNEVVEIDTANAALEAPDVVIVIAGDETMLHVARDVLNTHPNAVFVPLASTGGAAQAMFEADPDRFPKIYARELSYHRVFKALAQTLLSKDLS